MKPDGQIVIAISSILILCITTAAPAYSQVEDYVLFIEQTPVQAGRVTPSAGVHRFGQDDVITLTAIPRPGYQFMYWLGDVGEAANNSTTVLLNGPKIIVAVFERSKFVFILEEEPQSIGRGSELMNNNPVYLGGGDAEGAGYKNPGKYEWPQEEEPEESDFPVPEPDFPVPEPDFPVPNNQPIPEPATIALMSLGGLTLLWRRHKKLIFEGKQGWKSQG